MKYKLFWKIKYQVVRRRRAGAKSEYTKHKATALKMAKDKIAYFNDFYGFKVNRISVKNQKSRWGSCSKKGNLNFNYKIALLPQAMSDYIIVHELCHLGQFNHSPAFWNLVAKTIPNYKIIRRKFKKIHL